MTSLKENFLLDPNIVFLNHGSFGATPRAVFEAYQNWQLQLERQPVLFLARELPTLLHKSRAILGQYLNADTNDLVYIPNATHGVNIVAHSLQFKPGDEILTTDHEYGACDYTWDFICKKTAAKYIHQHIPLPAQSKEEIIEQFWQGVTPRTKVIYMSQITSSTALRLPVKEICKRASQAGILTIIDAAHSLGQIPLDLQDLDADIVFGNAHKWLMNAKGSAFLYVRRTLQPHIEPLIVSWGYQATPGIATGSRFVDYLQWTGTKDPTAYLTIPHAIQFMKDHNWDNVRHQCYLLLHQAIKRICDLTQLPPAYPLDSDFYSQMGIAPLPPSNNVNLKSRLYDEYKIEIPLTEWRGRQFVRISVQGYNTQEDIDALVRALEILLPQVAI
jgi:isopenicillin-N epimerase